MNDAEKLDIVERVPVFHFALITPRNAVVAETPSELWAAIAYRKSFTCKIFAEPDLKLLHCFVGQKFCPFYYENIYEEGLAGRLQIPLNNASYYAIEDGFHSLEQADEQALPFIEQNEITPDNFDQGCWAITGLNGFYVAHSASEMVGVLLSNKFKNPVAEWCCDFRSGLVKARWSYAQRFYQRFCYQNETLEFIPMDVHWFIDSAYEQRESRRTPPSLWMSKLAEMGLL
ncbi:hypothetical protein SDC9_20877 [bioreactor metagenome]|uniref:Uncharacterized protein n=1 Tax=bioreactor metagenome TaxID=1076179 RepID=A0A644U7X8_9ZZZZ|nr:hypothetical protein [Negativicutes bacterium]